MHFVEQRWGMRRWISIASAVGLLLFAPTGQLHVIFPILAAYPVIHLGMTDKVSFGNVTRFGDLSYGTYLYGWPIQQVVRVALGEGHSGWTLFFLSWPLALLCGFLSWHLVERHFVLARIIEWRDRLRARWREVGTDS